MSLDTAIATISSPIIREFLKNLDTKKMHEIYNNNDIKLNGWNKTENLSIAYKNDELVLVLGAGVSVSYNLPSWDNLLQKLLFYTLKNGNNDHDEDASTLLSKLFTRLFDNSPLISARYLEEYFKKKNLNLNETLRKVLYEGIDRTSDSDTYKEILQYCIAPGKSPNLDSIITYNYDDILETMLKNSKIEIPFKPIYKIGMNVSNGDLPIYHVHGYLPENSDIDEENIITLSENFYHKQYNEVYSWNNMVQINKFREKTCLFIGISLTDPNIRRLLDVAMMQRGSISKYHYLIKKRYKKEWLENKLKIILDNDNDLFNEKNRTNISLDDTVESLMKMMEEFEELDAQSFGLQIIWINDFSEIPIILKEIRQKQW